MRIANSYNTNVNPNYYKNLQNLTNRPAQSMNVNSRSVSLSIDALFSCGSPITGQTASVYRDESYTKDNPVMLVKGVDSQGNEYEERVNLKEVNPSHASYIEMVALSTYLDSEGKSNGANPGIEPSLCEYNDYFVKQDYITPLKWLAECQWKSKNLDGYAYLSNKLNGFMAFCKVKDLG